MPFIITFAIFIACAAAAASLFIAAQLFLVKTEKIPAPSAKTAAKIALPPEIFPQALVFMLLTAGLVPLALWALSARIAGAPGLWFSLAYTAVLSFAAWLALKNFSVPKAAKPSEQDFTGE
ncbi:MAG: hypothetical protein WCS77_02900 [Elusimicrobiaceae bacterium]